MSTTSSTVRIGSRKSKLALAQTYWVQEQLQKHYSERTFEVHTMSTQGDKILDVALAKIGDKGLFTKELEQGMLDDEIDFAVHSLKDLPTQLPEGLTIACITSRENPADALVVHEKHQDKQIDTLPEGSVIGTSSLRRLAQLRHYYPYFYFKDIRGNLNTRLSKLDAGDYDAIVLAAAGLERLDMAHRIHQILPSAVSLHAVGQGALGIECRSDRTDIMEVVRAIEDAPTALRCYAERAFLRELEGGCQVPIGVNSDLSDNTLTLTGMVASLDGKHLLKDTVSGNSSQAEALGIQLAERLRGQGAKEILDEIFADVGRNT